MVRALQAHEWQIWDAFVLQHPLASIYHTSAWRQTIKSTYGHTPFYLILQDETHNIKAGLPLFLVGNAITGRKLDSLPCAQACNPLVSSQAEYEQLMSFVLEFIRCKKVKYAEIKTSASFRNDSHKFGKAILDYSTYVLDLDKNLEEIENALHQSCVRRAIRKSAKSGVQIVAENSLDNLKAFYHLYLGMRKQKGLLPQPFKFFHSMWEKMSQGNHIDILSAEYEGQMISAIILLRYKDTVTYEYGASRPDVQRLSPSPLLLWEAIKRSHQQGFKKFDFGRTSNENKNLTRFKSRWGAKQEPLPYYFIPDLNGIDSIRQNALSKRIMHYAMHISPQPVCHTLGRLLYKHLV
ncbi:MAG: lipid II:glycine glycyltransferase FemX [bacterium]